MISLYYYHTANAGEVGIGAGKEAHWTICSASTVYEKERTANPIAVT